MVPVIYAPEAERDLEAITTFIANDNRLAAEQFGFRLIERAELLGAFPRLGRPVLGKHNVSRPVGGNRLKSTIDLGPLTGR
jgi:plasmid stabilization system protein ParE